MSEPKIVLSAGSPTCSQTERVTLSLSPVNIFTDTPYLLSALIAFAVDSFGGSKNAR